MLNGKERKRHKMWTIQNRPSTAFCDKDVEILTELGIEHDTFTILPMVDDPVSAFPNFYEVIDSSVIRGSTKVIELLHEYKEPIPGLFYNDNFKHSVWTKELGKDLLINGNGNYCVWQDFININISDLWFVRPDSDLKSFPGQVVDFTTINPEGLFCRLQTRGYPVKEYDQILFSKIKDIEAEFRFVLIGKEIFGAQYREEGRLISVFTPESENYAKAYALAIDIVAHKWVPHEICILDIAIEKGEAKIMEFNCFNCSGFYGKDIAPIYKEINAHVTKELTNA
jgi:hypothetical protein